jgi:hypothetical protein
MTQEVLMNQELKVYFYTDHKIHAEKKVFKIPRNSDPAAITALQGLMKNKKDFAQLQQ